MPPTGPCCGTCTRELERIPTCKWTSYDLHAGYDFFCIEITGEEGVDFEGLAITLHYFVPNFLY